MKGRIGSIPHSRHYTVLYGIEMNIVDMPLEIGVVAYGVFPKPPLPKDQFSVSEASDAHTVFYNCCRESTLDQAHSDWEVRVAGRQSHNEMHVIRPNHDRTVKGYWRRVNLNAARNEAT
jgi:hypothetical protein